MCKFRTLRADEIECRVARCTEKGAQLLLYKDARCDMAILDETVGAMNWQRIHGRDNANCTVAIWDAEKAQWISKEDTGTESNTEAEKGLASDSFKRACTNWGVGRELYTAPFIWVPGVSENRQGRWVCNEKFSVTRIEYDENRRITGLAIADKKGKEVYTMGGKTPAKAKAEKPKAEKPKPEKPPEPEKKPDEPKMAEIPPDDLMYRCEMCGKVLEPYKGPSGRMVGLMQHANASKKKFGHVLCLSCIENWPREQGGQDK